MVVHFDSPPQAVPADLFIGFIKRSHGDIGQEHPLYGFLAIRSVGLKDIDSVHIKVRQLFAVVLRVILRRVESEGSEPYGHGSGACLPRLTVLCLFPLRDVYRVRASLGLFPHMVPQFSGAGLCISGYPVTDLFALARTRTGEPI